MCLKKCLAKSVYQMTSYRRLSWIKPFWKFNLVEVTMKLLIIRKPWELCIQKTYKRLGLSRFSLHSVLFPSNGALLLTVKVYDGAKEMDLRISWNFHRERSVCPPMFILTVIYAHFLSFSDIFRKIIRKLMFLGVAFRVTSWAECTNFHKEL